jgi:adenosylcobyric acid synthase
MGSYLHGMFSGDTFRAAFLRDLGLPGTIRNHAAEVDQTLNALAAHIEAHLDVPALLALAADGLT